MASFVLGLWLSTLLFIISISLCLHIVKRIRANRWLKSRLNVYFIISTGFVSCCSLLIAVATGAFLIDSWETGQMPRSNNIAINCVYVSTFVALIGSLFLALAGAEVLPIVASQIISSATMDKIKKLYIFTFSLSFLSNVANAVSVKLSNIYIISPFVISLGPAAFIIIQTWTFTRVNRVILRFGDAKNSNPEFYSSIIPVVSLIVGFGLIGSATIDAYEEVLVPREYFLVLLQAAWLLFMSVISSYVNLVYCHERNTSSSPRKPPLTDSLSIPSARSNANATISATKNIPISELEDFRQANTTNINNKFNG